MSESPSSGRQTYPLSLLIVILTGCAVLAAVIAPQVRKFELDDWLNNVDRLVGAIVACGLGGALLGAFIGLHQFRRWQGVLTGAILGLFIGPVAGLLMTIDRQSVGSVVQAVLIGCAILVATAWLIRPGIREDDRDEVIDAVEAYDPPGGPR